MFTAWLLALLSDTKKLLKTPERFFEEHTTVLMVVVIIVIGSILGSILGLI